MAKPSIQNVNLSDTFEIWLERTNDLVDLATTDMMTASAGGDTTIGNATLQGTFTANTIVAFDTLRTDLITLKQGSPNPLVIQPQTSYTSTDEFPIVIQNGNNPKISIRNNGGAQWNSGLRNNTSNSPFNIGTVAASDLYEFSTAGRLTLNTVRLGTQSNKATITYTGDLTRTYTIPTVSNSEFVMTTGTQTIGGVKTFSSSIVGNIATATALQNARTINGTSFNGTANITTANWGTSRTLTIGLTGKSVNGSAAVSWSLSEIGAVPLTRTLTGGTGIATIGDLSSDRTISLEGQALAIHNLGSNGIVSRTGSGTFAARTITSATTGPLTVTNGDGVSGNPTLSINLASQAEANGGTVNNRLMTPLRTKDAIDTFTVGRNQTWQDVTASRSTFPFTYLNDTGKPIQLSIAITSGAGNRFYELSPTGIEGSWVGIALATAGRNFWNPIVPPGWYYRFRPTSEFDTGYTIHTWLELR